MARTLKPGSRAEGSPSELVGVVRTFDVTRSLWILDADGGNPREVTESDALAIYQAAW